MRFSLRSLVRLALTLGVVSSASACARGTPGDAGVARSNANEITRAEIESIQMPNVYELVSTLRSRWLQRRGPDSFGAQGEIQAYLGSTPLSGGVRALRDMPVTGVSHIEFVDAITASARWGLNHGQGAIVVTPGRH